MLDYCQKHQKVGLWNGLRPADFLHDFSVTFNRLKNAFDQGGENFGFSLLIFVLFFSLSDAGFQILEFFLHLMDVFFLLCFFVGFIGWLKLISEFGHLMLELLNLVALQIYKLEHLEILFFVFAEDSEELFKVLNFGSGLNFSKVFSELLYFFHLLWRLFSLSWNYCKNYFVLVSLKMGWSAS